MKKDILIRAGKTFIQAFVGSITIDTLFMAKDFNTAKRLLAGMAIAGLSAGISAVWNMAVGLIKEA